MENFNKLSSNNDDQKDKRSSGRRPADIAVDPQGHPDIPGNYGAEIRDEIPQTQSVKRSGSRKETKTEERREGRKVSRDDRRDSQSQSRTHSQVRSADKDDSAYPSDQYSIDDRPSFIDPFNAGEKINQVPRADDEPAGRPVPRRRNAVAGLPQPLIGSTDPQELVPAQRSDQSREPPDTRNVIR